MNNLLTYIPELFPELDEETEEEVRGRRSRVSRPSRRGGTPYRGKPKGIVMRPPVGPSGFYARPRLRPMPLPHLIPVVPPLWRSPWDAGRHDDTGRAQAGSQGSGEPSSSQSAEPPSEYVRWVQDSLNRALGLQLPIDGVMNRETRSAVRSFQERQGLPVNGLVGPETEAALKTASSVMPVPSRDISTKPETEWENPSSASCNCSSCKERTAMNYEPGFEADAFGGSTAFNEFEGFDTEVLDEWLSETPQQSS
ncbi:MAG: hypothetical protein H6Q85_2019, partial [candidate division NC10 bacterium]|nr:hypothetical protein [candidate division NC10 bacterium]